MNDSMNSNQGCMILWSRNCTIADAPGSVILWSEDAIADRPNTLIIFNRHINSPILFKAAHLLRRFLVWRMT